MKNDDPDAYWRRPVGGGEERPPPTTGQDVPEYGGPPPTVPPPPGWRPPLEVEPAPPRELPPQDHAALETEEQSARTFTYGIGMVAGAVLLIVICALCSRVLF